MSALSTVFFGTLGLAAADYLALFVHFLMLSMLAIGGAITTVPDMQRYIVGQRGWLGDADFTASVALAQAAPGPNVLFVAVIGYNVGGLVGVAAAMVGNLLPSTTLALAASRWGARHGHSRGLRAFTSGLAPVTLGLLGSTAWVLTEPIRLYPGAWALLAVAVFVMLRTKLSPLWPIALGAVAGALGAAG